MASLELIAIIRRAMRLRTTKANFDREPSLANRDEMFRAARVMRGLEPAPPAPRCWGEVRRGVTGEWKNGEAVLDFVGVRHTGDKERTRHFPTYARAEEWAKGRWA